MDASSRGKTIRARIGGALVALLAAGCVHGEPRPPCDDSGPIASLCGFRNPEDLEYVPTARLILVSNMRSDAHRSEGGFISGVFPGVHTVVRLWPGHKGTPVAPEPELGDPDCVDPPRAEALYPHGITSAVRDGRTLVYVVDHRGKRGGREAIEVFELSGIGITATLTWKACIPTDGGVQANDLAVAPDGTIVAANYQPNGSIGNTLSAALLGRKTGDIMRWRAGEGWRHLEGTEAAMANGVALSPDGKTLFYTETITGLLHRRPLDTNAGGISVEIGGNPDNLTWTPRGTLLVATHTAGAAFLLCSLGREPCRTSWKIDEIDPATLAVRSVLTHNGETIGAVATALEVGQVLYLGSVFDDRIGIVRLGSE